MRLADDAFIAALLKARAAEYNLSEGQELPWRFREYRRLGLRDVSTERVFHSNVRPLPYVELVLFDIWFAGWPLYSMYSDEMGVRIGSSWRASEYITHRKGIHIIKTGRFRGRYAPLLPYWPGFLFNTLFYAVLLWLLLCGPFMALRARRTLRRRRGQCEQCAYPIGSSPVCTECGAAVVRRPQQHASGPG